MMRKSISAKILLTTMLVVVVLASSLVLVMTYFMRSMTDTTLLNMLQPMAKTAAQSVEGNLHTLTDRLFLIRDNQLLGTGEDSLDDLQAALDRATSGIEFVWLGVYDTSGAMLTGSDGCPLSISGRQLYELIGQTENLVIEDTTVGSSGLEIVIGVPAWSGNDYKSAVEVYLVGSYKYDLISDVLGNINIGTNGTAFIIDEEGTVIAHKDRGMVYSQASIAQSLGSSPEAELLLDSMLQGQTGSARISVDGSLEFVSYAPIRGTRWSLGIQVPRSDFLSSLNQAITISIVVTVLLLAVVAAVQSLFTKRILSDPLHAITGSANQLAMGDFESALPEKVLGRPDEIGQLANAFSTMSASVQSVNQEIRQLTGAVRVGSLNQRADLTGHQGDYQQIISGINDTLDVISSHLDAMPGAFAMFNEAQRPIYINRTMLELSELHGIGPSCICMLASFVSSGEEYVLSDEVAGLFAPDCPVGTTYQADSSLTDRFNNVFNYHLTLLRTGLPAQEGQQRDSDICVMLIASDVTQLTRAKVEAEAASHAKSDFLSRMSHEMRTPMNAIIGMTAIAKAADDLARKEYCLDRISEASNHLLGVINDILDMSKIEADKFELSPAEFHFEKMLQRVTGVNNFRVEEKNQNLLVELDREIPTFLVADEQRLSQVLTNLLSNAVKFTPEGGTITLRAKRLAGDGERCTLRVEVQDTGIGISEEQMGRLFNSFEQADGSISRKYGGTGLGLAISKRIIEMMGGSIWVESALGQGSCFLFEITVPVGSQQPEPALSGEQGWSGLRVLAVDDAPEILELFQLMLSPYGIQCDVASSGQQAAAMLETGGEPYHIVFADWKMPKMSGIDLTRAIFAMPLAKKPVVVLITAADWSDIAGEARQAGVSRFLQKPLFPSMLVDCINECLTPRQVEKMETIAEAGESSDGIFTGKHVLLAEDVEINREILMALIEHTGVELEYAVDGSQAVEKYTAQPQRFDLILMDVHMPNVDGYEATRRIRASGLPGAETIPIIAMTANVFREDIERCLESGMNGHLGKPIDPDEVIHTMRQYLLEDEAAKV